MTRRLRAATCPGSGRRCPLSRPLARCSSSLLIPCSVVQRVLGWTPWFCFSFGSAVGHQMNCSPSLCLSFLICKVGCQSYNATSEGSLDFYFLPPLPKPQAPCEHLRALTELSLDFRNPSPRVAGVLRV